MLPVLITLTKMCFYAYIRTRPCLLLTYFGLLILSSLFLAMSLQCLALGTVDSFLNEIPEHPYLYRVLATYDRSSTEDTNNISLLTL